MTNLISNYKNLLSDLIKRYQNQTDYLAIRLEVSEGTNIVLRGNKIDTISEGISLGGQVRTCYQGGWGFATFNKLSNLNNLIEQAIAAARSCVEQMYGTEYLSPKPKQYATKSKGAQEAHEAIGMRI
jgi:TldD protein